MGKKISYKLKISRRAKRVRLAVHHNGRVLVTAPFGLERSAIEKIIYDKRKWILDKIRFFKSAENKDVQIFSPKDYLENKDNALVLVSERAEFYSKIYGFSFNNIFIRNQKTRWGSCSSDKNLNFNYKIVFLPQKHQDYIIAHEICHLKELNHSKSFWALLEKTIPNYLEIKKELRKHSLLYKRR